MHEVAAIFNDADSRMLKASHVNAIYLRTATYWFAIIDVREKY